MIASLTKLNNASLPIQRAKHSEGHRNMKMGKRKKDVTPVR